MRFAWILIALAVCGAPVAAELDHALVLQAGREGDVAVLIVPVAGPPATNTTGSARREDRLRAVHSRLVERARISQRGIVAYLAAERVEHRRFSVANAVQARVTPGQLRALAARQDVAHIVEDRAFRAELASPSPAKAAEAKAASSSLAAVGATALWAAGIRGQGIVVAGQDTGYQWNHPALIRAYRGYGASGTTHDHAWHDAIHGQVHPGDDTNPCGYDAPEPCDDDGHGTHTMGTVVGDDGGSNQIGMAPAARWIGCRNMDQGWGSPSTYLECLDFFLAPTDAQGLNPDPARAPHVINNSWGCPIEEGCDAAQSALLEEAVENLRDAGIVFVASAGNAGPSCGTIGSSPAYFAASLSIGAASEDGSIASFSSRGPAPGGALKPDLTAPGVFIRSAVPGNRYALLQGTSMASPHVAGAVALLLSAYPELAGRPDVVERVLRAGASPRTETGTDCGGYAGSAVPNAVHGHGFLDLVESVELPGERARLLRDAFE